MQEALAERDRHVKEVELKLLSVTQEMAANAGDFAQRMRDKDVELEQYKVQQWKFAFVGSFCQSS